MAETKCLTDGRKGRPRLNLNLKTREDGIETLTPRGPPGTSGEATRCHNPALHLWGPQGFKTSCAQGKAGLTNFHKWATCYPQLSGCTKRAHRQPGRRWKDSSWAAPGTEDATHPKRGFGRGAAFDSKLTQMLMYTFHSIISLN